MWLAPEDAGPPKDQRPMVNFYSDESCQTAHQYLVLGTISVYANHAQSILDRLAEIRAAYGHEREVGWSTVSKYKYGLYEDWVTTLQLHLALRNARFGALIHDSALARNRPKEDVPELGFNKLLYQSLLHQVGRRYRGHRLYGFLDSRTTKHDPETLRKILNAGLAKHWDDDRRPFIDIRFQDSKKSDLVQLTDLITGAIAFSRNGKATRPEKHRLADRILRLESDIWTKWRFHLWNFVPYKEGDPRT